MLNVILFSDINECAPAPCQNGATCVDLVGSYRCDCKSGYTGNNCETGKNSGPGWLFKGWIKLSTGQITLNLINVNKTKCTIRGIEIYPVDRVIEGGARSSPNLNATFGGWSGPTVIRSLNNRGLIAWLCFHNNPVIESCTYLNFCWTCNKPYMSPWYWD